MLDRYTSWTLRNYITIIALKYNVKMMTNFKIQAFLFKILSLKCCIPPKHASLRKKC